MRAAASRNLFFQGLNRIDIRGLERGENPEQQRGRDHAAAVSNSDVLLARRWYIRIRKDRFMIPGRTAAGQVQTRGMQDNEPVGLRGRKRTQ